MRRPRFPYSWQVVLAAAFITILVLAGFVATSRTGSNRFLTKNTTVNVVMGYIPNVQFAPFYAAARLGYYRSAGLNVQFNYATEPDALKLLSQGSTDFVDSGGDQVLASGAGGLHVKYVWTQYSRFPSALFFLKSSDIRGVRDLKGKSIGIPAETGASYYGLLALLGHNGLSAGQVKIEPINYNQVADVADHKVDAAMGYAPNEPVELRFLGKHVGEFDVYHWANIAGAGLATSNSLIRKNPALVRAFVQATAKGMRYTIQHPSKAFAICRQSISGLTDPKLQRAVLTRAIAFWRPAGVGLGRMDARVWRLTARILAQYKQIPTGTSASSYYTNRFVG